MSSELKLYNTLNRSKQTFVPLNVNNVRVYVCGPTVYDYPHVGNARPLIIFDLLFRLLNQIFGKEKVQYVRNITDVDDKILESAKSKNISIQDLTKKVIKDFHDDCSYLNCLTPTKEPKATDHIQEMIELTTKLIEKKFAYIEKGHVYFEVSKYKDYGSLSNKKIEVPSCFIAGEKDWGTFQKPGSLEKMENILCANYCGRHIIENAGHWVQQENPDKVIKTLLDFYKNK